MLITERVRVSQTRDEHYQAPDVDNRGKGTGRAFLTVFGIFSVSLVFLLYIYMNFPDLEEEERQHVKLPRDINDAKQLGIVLDRYKERYFWEVLIGVFIVYIFLQTFAIPGSIFLSILSGFLFPFPMALMLVCFCSASGASLCYMLSSVLGQRIVSKYFPQKAAQWGAIVDRHRNNILNYIIFLRVTPFLPNWFINIASPVIGVPLMPFWIGTFVGVAPPSFVAIQAGQTLHDLSTASDAWSWNSVMLLTLFGVLSLAPVVLKNQLKEKFE
ncbi:transmembrane protein 41B [Anabrus simplex]|uniref:transmembrane protein 41B n=1 Tax=Anabrus simplex TaxID=316456 RepID=UPI0034DCDF50